MTDWQQTQDDAVRTEPSKVQYAEAHRRLHNHQIMRLLHAAIGLCTEVGELQDQLKRHIFYDKTLDNINLIEEGGDISWYLRILADSLHDHFNGLCSFEQMIITNILKLKKRFPDKFMEDKALNRDLDGERQTLEGEPPLSGRSAGMETQHQTTEESQEQWPTSAGE